MIPHPSRQALYHPPGRLPPSRYSCRPTVQPHCHHQTFRPAPSGSVRSWICEENVRKVSPGSVQRHCLLSVLFQPLQSPSPAPRRGPQSTPCAAPPPKGEGVTATAGEKARLQLSSSCRKPLGGVQSVLTLASDKWIMKHHKSVRFRDPTPRPGLSRDQT